MIPPKTLTKISLALLLVVLSGNISAAVGTLTMPALAAPPAPTGVVYYISNEGNDSDDGLAPETAWQTLEHVSEQTFQPGDAVLFRRGDTWRDTLYITSSGTAAAQITFGAYGSGAKPRILGSEIATGWTEVATNIWQSSTPLDNPYQGGYSYAEVFFEELNGAYSWGEQTSYDGNFSQMTKEYNWSWNANQLYVYAPENPSARYAAVETPQRDSCVSLPGVNGSTVTAEDYVEYVTIDNLTLMYAMRQGFFPGYNEVEAHGLRLTNNHIGMIGVKGGRSAYCIAAWHSDMLIQNNTIHDCGRRGISLNTYTDYTPGFTVRNVTIDGNHFANGFHTTGPDIASTAELGHTFSNITISNNVFDDSARGNGGINDGCYTENCTSNTIFISKQTGNHYSNFYIYNNIIIDSTSRAMQLEDLDNVHVYHNTVYGSHPDAKPYGLVLFNNVTNIDMRNNIIHGTLVDTGGNNYGRGVLDENASSFSIRNYNLYYQEDPRQPISGSEHGIGGWNVFMDEWDSWQTASGFEANSPAPRRPLFVDRENADFNLQDDSPALDTGVLIPGINDDYNGAAPDIGALEFTPALTLYGAPDDRAIDLTWSVNATLPETTTWRIEYYSSTTVLTASNPLSTTRAHTLSDLTNYVWYTVTLSALLDTSTILSDTLTVMPTNTHLYLPLVLKAN